MRKNFIWVLFGNAGYSLLQWGMVVVIAKLGTPEMLGQFALGLAIAGPIFIMCQLQLRAVYVTDVHNQYAFGQFLALRVVAAISSLVLVLGAIWLLKYERQTALVVGGIGLAKAAETLSDIVYGFLQKQERFEQIAFAMIGRGLGSLLLLSTVLYLTRDLALGVGALALWWIVWLATYERGMVGRSPENRLQRGGVSPVWEPRQLMTLAWLSLPLGFVAGLISLNTNVPRYFIEHHVGASGLGFYASMAYIAVVGNTVIGALGQSASPRLARLYISDARAFGRLLTKMLLLAAALGGSGILVAMCAGRELLTFLYGPAYADHAGVFVWVMIVAVFGYLASMFGYSMTAMRLFRIQVRLYGVATVVSVLASWLLVPRFGVLGGVLASLVAAIVICVGSAYVNIVGLRSPRVM